MDRGGTIQEQERRHKDHNKPVRGEGEDQGVPEASGKRLRYTDFWSTRIGDYRAIYEIKRDGGQVVVLYVGHRRNVYDDFSRIF